MVKSYLLRCEKLFNGIEEKLFENIEVLVEGKLIKAVGHNLACPPGTKIVDLSGLTVTPGMIDSHLHAAQGCRPEEMAEGYRYSDSWYAMGTIFNLRRTLERGFTTIRMPGGLVNTFGSWEVKKAIEEGYFADCSRFVLSCHGVGTTGHHGDFSQMLAGNPTVSDANICPFTGDGPAFLSYAVRREIKYGCDFLKILLSGGFYSPIDGPEDCQLTDDELKAIIETAHGAFKTVTAHVYSPKLMQKLVAFGLDGIEHGALMDEETARILENSNVYVVPTFMPYNEVIELNEERLAQKPPRMQEKLKMYSEQLRHSRQVIVNSNIKLGYAEGQFIPNLAKSWDVSDDNRVFTFHLQENVTWSDGEKFTAEDVAYSFQYFKDSTLMNWIYKDCEQFEVVDELTFRLHMNAPNASILSFLSWDSYGPILPKHGLEKYGESFGTTPENIIGTGAYRVTDFQQDISITYVAKEDYWNGPADIKNLVMHKITDQNTALVALQTGELDVYFNPISGDAYRTLAKSENIVFGEYASPRSEAIYMYNKSGTFADKRMRQAVAHAVNKEDMLTIAMDGLGTTITYPGDVGPSMTGNPDFTPSISYENDLDKARALVEECGMVGQTVTIKCYNTDPYQSLSIQLQSVLNSIGLDAVVQPLERSAFLDEMAAEQVEIFPLSWIATTYDFDDAFGSVVHSANHGRGGNNGFYTNAEMNALVEQGRATIDEEARHEIYREAVELFMEECPYVSTYSPIYAVPRTADIFVENPKTCRMFDYQWVD